MPKKLITIAILLLAVSCWAADKTIYIDSTWTGTESGTEAEPYNSIADITAGDWTALNASAVAGDIPKIIASAGVYRGMQTITTPGTSDHPIQIIGAGSDATVVTSRILLSGVTWADAGSGVWSYDTSVSNIEVFWAGVSGDDWGTEITENTSTPTTPDDGEWGVSGTTLYYNPTTGTPNDTGAFSEYSVLNEHGGFSVQASFYEISGIGFDRSARFGVWVGTPSPGTDAVEVVNLTNCNFNYNGNNTESTSNGNGLQYGRYSKDSTCADSTASYNEDFGFIAERLDSVSKAEMPTNVTFLNCIGHNNNESGGGIQGTTGYLADAIFDGCIFYSNGWSTVQEPKEAGIQIHHGEGIIKNCHIYSNIGAGIMLDSSGDDSDGNAGNMYIIGNVIHDNNQDVTGAIYSGGVTVRQAYGASTAGTRGTVYLYGNTIFNEPYAFQAFYGSPANTKFVMKNNVLFNSTTYDIMHSGNPADTSSTFNHNLYSDSGPTAQIRSNGISYTTASTWNVLSYVSDEIFADPLLTTNGKLKTGSPSLDAGIEITDINDSGEDIWGNDGQRTNIGAYWGYGVRRGSILTIGKKYHGIYFVGSGWRESPPPPVSTYWTIARTDLWDTARTDLWEQPRNTEVPE